MVGKDDRFEGALSDMSPTTRRVGCSIAAVQAHRLKVGATVLAAELVNILTAVLAIFYNRHFCGRLVKNPDTFVHLDKRVLKRSA